MLLQLALYSSQQRYRMLGLASDRLKHGTLMLQRERLRREIRGLGIVGEGEMHFCGAFSEESDSVQMTSLNQIRKLRRNFVPETDRRSRRGLRFSQDPFEVAADGT